MKKASILRFWVPVIVINIFITLLIILIYNNHLPLILKSLNQDYANLMVVLVTAIYTVFSSLAFFEMYKQRKREESPELTLVFTKSNRDFINFQIKNISKVPAYDIKFTEFPDVKLFNNKGEEVYNVREKSIIKKGISYMGPSQVYDVLFDFPDAKHKDQESDTIDYDVEYSISFNVEYKDKIGNKYELKVSTTRSTLEFVGEDNLSEIKNVLESIASKLGSLGLRNYGG